MVLGLCSSIAVLPAFSVVKAGTGGPRLTDSARPLGDGADVLNTEGGGGSSGLAALLVADAALAVATQPSPAGVAPAGPVSGSGSLAAHAAPPSRAAPPPVKPAAPVVAPAAAGQAASPTPTPPVPAPAGRAARGVASWLDIAPGTCATNDAPMGAVITVTNVAGISVTCRVVSRGPFVAGRVVDLARSTFALLGPVSQGLVQVSITW